ncbi:DHS-like NAD/FAD-binding domain-containing protein [Xylaria sp. FL0064]|nr:DHS-like NAD/FAD-binding domain-containing protein [Xylaria sp. FL0064]
MLQTVCHTTAGSYDTLEELAKVIARSNRVIAITGAGISTSAGIPDFELLNFNRPGVKTRDLFQQTALSHPSDGPALIKLCLELFEHAETSQPSLPHRFLMDLLKSGQLVRTYTQNIDCLEEQAGLCIDPGLLRPGILLYNELDLRAQTIAEIIQHNLSLDVDLLLILGTSLIVHGIQKLTRKFAKLAHKNDGLVLYINQKGPPRKHWDGVVDYWVEWKCDAWVNDLTTRDRWLSTAGCLKSATIDDEVLRLERKRLAAEPDHIARHVRRRCNVMKLLQVAHYSSRQEVRNAPFGYADTADHRNPPLSYDQLFA